MKNTSTIEICIGSYGAYASANERSLGSKWFDLSNYHDWEEIADELTADGWDLNGEDEELFIQGSSGADIGELDIHPSELLELLQESEIFEDEWKFELMKAYEEVNGFASWLDLVRDKGSSWHYDIQFWSGSDIEDVAYEILNECHNIPSYLENYIDYKAFARDLGFDGYYETSHGVIYIG